MKATDLLQRCLDEIDCDVYSDPVTVELVQDIKNYLKSALETDYVAKLEASAELAWRSNGVNCSLFGSAQADLEKAEMTLARIGKMLETPQCYASGKQDGGHSLDYRDGGRCDWCGEVA